MSDKKVLRGFVMISQIGISMLVPIALCGALGWWVSRLAGQEIWFVLFLVLGIGAAFRNLYLLTRSFYAEDLKKEQQAQDYMKDLKEYREKHPEEDFSDVMAAKKKRYPENKGETRH